MVCISSRWRDGCRGSLGCPHYLRRCAVVAPCCERTYTCRECHDEAEADHDLDSKLVEHMLCMECNSRQPAAGQRFYLLLCRACCPPFGSFSSAADRQDLVERFDCC